MNNEIETLQKQLVQIEKLLVQLTNLTTQLNIEIIKHGKSGATNQIFNSIQREYQSLTNTQSQLINKLIECEKKLVPVRKISIEQIFEFEHLRLIDRQSLSVDKFCANRKSYKRKISIN